MKLSVVIVTCDKDYFNLDNLLKQAKNQKIDVETVVCDNRNYKDSKPDCDVYINMHGNKYQFEARRQAMYKATGDYVWFVDGDDEILEIDDKIIDEMNKGTEVIAFSYYDDADKNEPGCVKSNNVADWQLYNKFFKSTVIERVRDWFPKDKIIVANEDFIINKKLQMHAESKAELPESIPYRFSFRVTVSGKKNLTLDEFKHITTGLDYSQELMALLDCPVNYDWYFEKALLCDEPTEAFTILKNIFTEEIFDNQMQSLPLLEHRYYTDIDGRRVPKFVADYFNATEV